MKIKKTLLSLTITLLFSVFIHSQNITVSNIEEYNTAIKNISNGATIILKNGEWKDVIQLKQKLLAK